MTTSSSIHALLHLISASGETVDSRIRLQKEVFLLRWLGHRSFVDFHFSYYHYGPYSRGLSDVLHSAVLAGFLHEERQDFENDHTRYTYSLTEKGRHSVPNEVGASSSRSIAQRLGSEHWQTLELAATALFLEEDRDFDLDAALKRALELKPKCREYKDKAVEVIDYLFSMRRGIRSSARS